MDVRFALWAAVSTGPQAKKDKISLDNQLDKGRDFGLSRVWRETAGPFVVRGESRTQWINLRDAEEAIQNPDGSYPLREMLESAKRGEYDILIVYNLNRFRELIDQITRSLAAYGVQVYSLAQVVEPDPPEVFRKKRKLSGTASMVNTMATLTSRSEMDSMGDRLRDGIIGRIPKGLHPSGKVPYGYRYPDIADYQKYPLQIYPEQAAVLVKIKDLFLSGWTAPQIARYLGENGIPASEGGKKWQPGAVRYMLRNPFYAGEVSLGNWKSTNDPRTGKQGVLKSDPDDVKRGDGKHEPLWDTNTHNAIQAELARRSKRCKGIKSYTLSLLLACPEHDRTLHVKHVGGGIRLDHKRVWLCPISVDGHWHNFIYDSVALKLISDRLVEDIENMSKEPILPPKHKGSQAPVLYATDEDLLARKGRLLDALEAGALDAATYKERVKDLDKKLAEVAARLLDAEAAQAQAAQRVVAFRALADVIAAVPDIILKGDPQTVNQQLRNIISKVYVHPTGEIDIVYR